MISVNNFFGVIAAVLIAAQPVSAEELADFFAGRSITFVSPIAGDPYSRAIARHMVKYMPGNPSIRFKHMPGERSRVIARWMQAQAPRDGLMVAGLLPDAIMEPLIGNKKKTGYDPLAFAYIGSAHSTKLICISDKGAPVRHFGDTMLTPLILGATRGGGVTNDMALALRNLVGSRFSLVSNYTDVSQVIRALRHGEVQGLCGYGWSSFSTGRLDLIRDGRVNVLVQLALDKDEELTAKGVPTIWEFVDDPADRETLQLLASAQFLGRPFAVPDGVPRARTNALRVAFERTMRDLQFRADARRSGIDIAPTTGESVQKLVKKIYATPKSVIEKAKLARKSGRKSLPGSPSDQESR